MNLAQILPRLNIKGVTHTTDGAGYADFLVKLGPDGMLDSSLVGGTLDITGVSGNFTIGGNLTVQGTTTTLNTADLEIEDANILLRKGALTADDGGISIERGGDGDDASILWDESASRWKVGLAGAEVNITIPSDLGSAATLNATLGSEYPTSFNNLSNTVVKRLGFGFIGAPTFLVTGTNTDTAKIYFTRIYGDDEGVTIEAPVVTAERTITFPDASGTFALAETVAATYAPLASPSFTGTVVLPSTTSIGTVSNTEISYLDGVTSALQTQLDLKAPLASPALTGTPTAPTATGGTNTTQIATTAFVTTALSGVSGKRTTVRLATTAAITIATDLNAGDTIDGVTLVAGDLVLVKNQASMQQNGIYEAGASPARASDYDAYNDYPGAVVTVQQGTANADRIYHCTSNAGGTIDVTGISFQRAVWPTDLPIPIAEGGTAATNATTAINNLVPSQATHDGKFLSTNGVSVYWNTVSKVWHANATLTRDEFVSAATAATITIVGVPDVSDSDAFQLQFNDSSGSEDTTFEFDVDSSATYTPVDISASTDQTERWGALVDTINALYTGRITASYTPTDFTLTLIDTGASYGITIANVVNMSYMAGSDAGENEVVNGGTNEATLKAAEVGRTHLVLTASVHENSSVSWSNKIKIGYGGGTDSCLTTSAAVAAGGFPNTAVGSLRPDNQAESLLFVGGMGGIALKTWRTDTANEHGALTDTITVYVTGVTI